MVSSFGGSKPLRRTRWICANVVESLTALMGFAASYSEDYRGHFKWAMVDCGKC